MDPGRRATIAAVGTGFAALAGCTGALGLGRPHDDGSGYDVGMSSTAFLPETIEVAVGETVVWENTSSRGHTVTAYENAIPEDAAFFATGGFADEQTARERFESSFGGVIYGGQTFEHRFTVPGEHPYFCIPHEDGEMVGTVVVREQ